MLKQMLSLILLVFYSCNTERQYYSNNDKNLIEKVAVTIGKQFTGIAISKDGRLFTSFPRWRDSIQYSVAEVFRNNSFVAYPDERWNKWQDGMRGDSNFVCVQSLFIDDENYLWVLDPASPKLKGTVPNSAKLIKYDLTNNTVVQTILFDDSIAPKESYLNDVRVDVKNQVAYLTCSGKGAIVIVNLKTNQVKRVLESSRFTKAENIILKINGTPLVFPNGSPLKIHSDGIALDNKNDYLYFHSLTGYHLYRIKTTHLLNEELEENDLANFVEDLGKTVASDGMIIDKKGNLIFADLENQAIMYFTPTREIKTLVKSDKLRWVDSFSISADQYLYFTCSHIDETEWFVPHADVSKMTFEIYKIDISGL